MVPAWTVTLSYIGYAAVLVLGAATWLVALFDTIVRDRVELGTMSRDWLDVARLLMRGVEPTLWTCLACTAAAFILAALPAGEAAPIAKAHKAYQLRIAALAVFFIVLLALTNLRMGALDADVGAVVLFAWSLWVVAAGWFAYAGATPVAGPELWWLALAADLLLLGTFAFFWIMLEIQGFRMF